MPATAPISGIYKILCVPTGKFYIGSSVNVRKRWTGHKADLRKGAHCSTHLQRAWNKYGEKAFEFMLLETVPAVELLAAEQRWLDSTRCYDRTVGFNTAHCAAAPAQGLSKSPEARARMVISARRRWESSEARAQKAKEAREYAARPGVLERMSAAAKEAWARPGMKERMSEALVLGFSVPGVRLKMSESARAKPPISELTSLRMSAAQRARAPRSAESRARTAEANRRRGPRSAETKAKIAAGRLQRSAEKRAEASHV